MSGKAKMPQKRIRIPAPTFNDTPLTLSDAEWEEVLCGLNRRCEKPELRDEFDIVFSSYVNDIPYNESEVRQILGNILKTLPPAIASLSPLLSERGAGSQAGFRVFRRSAIELRDVSSALPPLDDFLKSVEIEFEACQTKRGPKPKIADEVLLQKLRQLFKAWKLPLTRVPRIANLIMKFANRYVPNEETTARRERRLTKSIRGK